MHNLFKPSGVDKQQLLLLMAMLLFWAASSTCYAANDEALLASDGLLPGTTGHALASAKHRKLLQDPHWTASGMTGQHQGRDLRGTRPSLRKSGLWADAAGSALATASAGNGLTYTNAGTFQKAFTFDNKYAPVAGAFSSSNAVSLSIGDNAKAGAFTKAIAATGAGR
eukprot:gene11734-11878_t